MSPPPLLERADSLSDNKEYKDSLIKDDDPQFSPPPPLEHSTSVSQIKGNFPNEIDLSDQKYSLSPRLNNQSHQKQSQLPDSFGTSHQYSTYSYSPPNSPPSRFDSTSTPISLRYSDVPQSLPSLHSDRK